MFHIHVPIGLAGLVLALGAGSAAWTAKIEGRDGSKITGTAQVESASAITDSATAPRDTTAPADTTPKPATPPPGEVRVTISLDNAPANASLSWYLYNGKCSAESAGDAESIVGVTSSYSPIKVDASGHGTITLPIRGAEIGTGMYYVGIIAGGKLAACGDLEQSKTST